MIETTARAIFDKLSEGTPKRTPDWDKQPEHLKDVFRAAVVPGTIWYHYGANLACIIRGDLTPAFYTPATERLALRKFNGVLPAPRGIAKIQLDKEIAKATEAARKPREAAEAAEKTAKHLRALSDVYEEHLAELMHRKDLITG